MKLKLNGNALNLDSMKTSSRSGLTVWPMSTSELEASKSSNGMKPSPKKRSMCKESRHSPESKRTRGNKLAKRSAMKKRESRLKKENRLRKSVTPPTLPRSRREKNRGPNAELKEWLEVKSSQMKNKARRLAIMRVKTRS